MYDTTELNQSIVELKESLIKLLSILPITIIAIAIFAGAIILLIKLRIKMTEIEKERELEELKPILDYHTQQIAQNIKNLEIKEDIQEKDLSPKEH